MPVPYFHPVFTLPHELNGLIGIAPRALYEMLFGAVSATLTEFAANPRWLGGRADCTHPPPRHGVIGEACEAPRAHSCTLHHAKRLTHPASSLQSP